MYLPVTLLTISISITCFWEILPSAGSFQTNQACPNRAVSKKRQVLVFSPNYLSSYKFDGSCWEFVIKSPFRCPTQFHIQFLEFLVEFSPGCINEFVAISSDDDGGTIVDVLCGQINGIKVYNTSYGILNIYLQTDKHFEMVKSRFKLLVTRTSCVDSATTISSKEMILKPSLFNKTVRSRELSIDRFFEQKQKPSFQPQQCCSNSFNKEQFYLTSPGFPTTTFTSLLSTVRHDCVFFIEKSSLSVCRLQVEFKFFDFGIPNNLSGEHRNNCSNDFLEIDGQRYCGCQTGQTITMNHWDYGPKIIRLRMGYYQIATNGFLIHLRQENCHSSQEHYKLKRLTGNGENGTKTIHIKDRTNLFHF